MRIRNRSTHLSLFLSHFSHRGRGERVMQLKEAEDNTSLEKTGKKKKESADPNCDSPPRLLLPDSHPPATGSLLIRQKINFERATTTTLRRSPIEEDGQKEEKREGAREEGEEDRYRQRFEAPNEHYSQENSDFSFKRRRNLEWASDDGDNYGYDGSDEEYNIQNKKKKAKVIEKKWMCTRMNGRGWRCSKPTLIGYSLCEHHLGKGRRTKTINTLAPEKQKDRDHDHRVKAPSTNGLLSDHTSKA